MPVTVKVNGTVNSLVHKGSNHISAATIPDVCKTPSPGGPVPIPYPNVSQSATLAKGTTTVKADGGMMIANKDSEFSLSNGDNAGVAGGVKSSTFMKESTWILYSFDVKMDGAGACRLSDKKFQNHENTADLMGTVGAPVEASAPIMGPDCNEVRKDNGWDDCMCAQVCEMVKAYNDSTTEKKKLKPSPTRAGSKSVERRAYVQSLSDFDAAFARTVDAAKGDMNAQSIKDMFYSPPPPNQDCQHKKWVDAKSPMPPPRSGAAAISPDHMHPVSLNGPMSVDNMKWADAEVNTKVGGGVKGKKYDPAPEKVRAHPNCNCG
jgi:hypothetical protein